MSGIGERIRERRKSKGMTLDDLAAASGSSKSYVWELENKNPPRPSAEKLTKIAEALGVTSDYLMGVPDVELASAEDKAFFRSYSNLSPQTREKIRRMAELLGDEKK